MIMRINEFIKKKRIEKEIGYEEFAEIIGENSYWIEEFESDEEELNGLTIPQLKKMCEALSISVADLFRVVPSNLMEFNLSKLVKKRREEKFWSIEDLGDRIGYKSGVIKAIENNYNLNEVCLDALKKIATELDLPLYLILEKL
jgi:transcriptional regulator with XRE-family HTH domain